MTVTAKDFFASFKKLNAHMTATKDASDDLQKSFSSLAAAFRGGYTADEFRQAIAEDRDVSSDLEEKLTSTLMIVNRERATRS